MRFKDERHMWYADTQALAQQLANKAELEVQEILDQHNVIQLRTTDRPKRTFLNRVTLLVVYLPLLVLCGAKWVFTGDPFLDSWAKKSRVLRAIFNFSGIADE